jgi:hypothetical protein
MNESAVSAEPIKTATPTRKAIPPKMKTTHETSLRVMMGGRSTAPSSTPIPPVFPLSWNPYNRPLRFRSRKTADANGVLTNAAKNGDTSRPDGSVDEDGNLGSIGLPATRRY